MERKRGVIETEQIEIELKKKVRTERKREGKKRETERW